MMHGMTAEDYYLQLLNMMRGSSAGTGGDGGSLSACASERIGAGRARRGVGRAAPCGDGRSAADTNCIVMQCTA